MFNRRNFLRGLGGAAAAVPATALAVDRYDHDFHIEKRFLFAEDSQLKGRWGSSVEEGTDFPCLAKIDINLWDHTISVKGGVATAEQVFSYIENWEDDPLSMDYDRVAQAICPGVYRLNPPWHLTHGSDKNITEGVVYSDPSDRYPERRIYVRSVGGDWRSELGRLGYQTAARSDENGRLRPVSSWKEAHRPGHLNQMITYDADVEHLVFGYRKHVDLFFLLEDINPRSNLNNVPAGVFVMGNVDRNVYHGSTAIVPLAPPKHMMYELHQFRVFTDKNKGEEHTGRVNNLVYYNIFDPRPVDEADYDNPWWYIPMNPGVPLHQYSILNSSGEPIVV